MPIATSSNIFFIHKKLLQSFRKSICLLKEFFLVNSFIGVFWGTTSFTSFTTITSQNTTYFGYFFHCTVNLLLPLNCLLLNKTPLKLCKRKSNFLFRMLYPVFVVVSMAQHVENFDMEISHDHICQRSLKIQFRSLKLHFRTGRSSPYNFPFVSLVLSKPKQICIKKS